MIHHIHSITRNQVTLDRCTGNAVLKLRAVAVTMDDSYRRLEAYRLMVIAISVANPLALPEALELFKQAAQLERYIQQNAKMLWELEESKWSHFGFFHCGVSWHTRFSPFPAFPFSIVNPELGFMDLSKMSDWKNFDRATFRVHLESGKLQSKAALERKPTHEWSVAWTL